MEPAKELWMYAKECRRMAGAAPSEQERRAWNAMADQCETKAKVVDGAARAERRPPARLRSQRA